MLMEAPEADTPSDQRVPKPALTSPQSVEAIPFVGRKETPVTEATAGPVVFAAPPMASWTMSSPVKEPERALSGTAPSRRPIRPGQVVSCCHNSAVRKAELPANSPSTFVVLNYGNIDG
jgi:hypothetical protein